jgi:hypothetical protein
MIRMTLAVLICCATFHQSAAQSTISIPNAGDVTTVVKVENGVLAVRNQIVRPRSAVRECVGACFYATKTATKTWICRQGDCSLDCAGRDPVGGCRAP